MKVVCIDDAYGKMPLTIGKTYHVYDDSLHVTDNKPVVCIKDDSGSLNAYYFDRFKLLEEVRNDKLNDLGI